MENKRVLAGYRRRGFFEGMARVLDLGAILSRQKRLPLAVDADATALRTDWMAVGQDLRNAIGAYELGARERSSGNRRDD